VSISRIKKGDEVVVITGADAGRTGRVLTIDTVRQRAVVEGLNVRKKAVRRSDANPQGGFIDINAPVALSNLMPYDPSAKKGVRIRRVREAGRTVRQSKASSHSFS